MSANSDPSHNSVSVMHSLFSVLILAPSGTLKICLQSLFVILHTITIFTFMNCIQVLSSVSVWRRALRWSSCSGCGCGVAACLWHSGWIREHSSVARGFAPLHCHLDDLATLHCSASICGAALHLTPPPPGARLMCHWHINLPVQLVGQKG